MKHEPYLAPRKLDDGEPIKVVVVAGGNSARATHAALTRARQLFHVMDVEIHHIELQHQPAAAAQLARAAAKRARKAAKRAKEIA